MSRKESSFDRLITERTFLYVMVTPRRSHKPLSPITEHLRIEHTFSSLNLPKRKRFLPHLQSPWSAYLSIIKSVPVESGNFPHKNQRVSELCHNTIFSSNLLRRCQIIAYPESIVCQKLIVRVLDFSNSWELMTSLDRLHKSISLRGTTMSQLLTLYLWAAQQSALQSSQGSQTMCVTCKNLTSGRLTHQVALYPQHESNNYTRMNSISFVLFVVAQIEDVYNAKERYTWVNGFILSIVSHRSATRRLTLSSTDGRTQDVWMMIASHTLGYSTKTYNSIKIVDDWLNRLVFRLSFSSSGLPLRGKISSVSLKNIKISEHEQQLTSHWLVSIDGVGNKVPDDQIFRRKRQRIQSIVSYGLQ